MNQQYLTYLNGLEQKYGLPTGLLPTVMQTESSGDPAAVSPKGAMGLFQFMPDTAKQYKIDPLDPEQAGEGAAHMFSDLGKKYNGDIPSVLAAYNWGSGNLDNKGLPNAPDETKNYISKIMGGLQAQYPADNQAPPSAFSKLVGGIGNAIIPQAQAAELSDWEPASDGQTALQQVSAQPLDQSSPNEWEPINQLDSKNKIGALHQMMLGNADAAMGSDASLLGVPATLTAYGANALQAVPFGDELGSALAATIGVGTGDTWKQRYDSLQQSQQAMREAGGSRSEKYSPGATTLGQIGAGLALTPFLPGPGKVSGSALAAFGQGAGAGAAYGGVYGAGDTNSFLPDNEALAQRGGNAAKGAVIGAAVGAPLGVAGYALSPKQTQITSADIRDMASKSYDDAANMGGTLTPKFTDSFVDEASKSLPQTPAGKIVAGENSVTKLVDRMQALKGKPLSLNEAQEIDEQLSNQIDNFVDKTTGRLSKEGKQLYDIQSTFRDMIKNAKPGDISGSSAGFEALKNARMLWAKQARIGEIERIIARGQSMDNPATSIRSGFRTLMNNPSRMRGYTEEERALIKQAAKAGIGQEALRAIGSRLLTIGTLGMNHVLGAAASTVVGAGARSLGGRAQAAAGQKVIDQIAGQLGARANSPQLLNSALAGQGILSSQNKLTKGVK